MPKFTVDPAMRAALTKALAARKKKKKAGQLSTRKHDIGYSSGISLWPKQYRAKLRYRAVSKFLAGTSDIWNDQYWQTNSIFDPYVPAGGGNPKGYTDLKAHYAHYMVLGCKVTVEFVLRTGNTMVCTLTNCEDTTAVNLVNKDDRLNDERTKYCTLHNESPRGTLVQYYSKNKVFGNGKNSELTAAFAANPAEGYFALIGTQNLGAGLAQSVVDYTITLVYDVICTEKLDTPNE